MPDAGISELDAGDVGRDRQMVGGLLAPFGRLAHAVHDLVVRREHGDLELRQHRRHVAHDEGDFGIGLGRRRLVGRVAAARRGFGEQPLRIERRDIGGEIGDGERQIAGDAHEGPHAHHLVIADPVDGGDADHLAGEGRLFRGRQPVALARACRAYRRRRRARRAARPRPVPGSEAKLVSPSSDVKTAPPIRAAPHNAVRIVPANHCTETRRRSTKPLVPPSTDSGGSLPSSMRSACLDRYAPRDREWSKLAVPCACDRRWPAATDIAPVVAAGPRIQGRHDAGWSVARQ